MLLLILLVIAALYFFSEVLLPFALALFFAYLLAPVIDWINRLRVRNRPVPRAVAILAVYAVILGLIVLSGFYLFPQFYSEVNRMVRTFPNVLRDVEANFVLPLETRMNEWFAAIIPPPQVEEIPEEDQDQNGASGPTLSPNGKPAPQEPWQALVENYTYVVQKLDENSFEVIPKKRRQKGSNGNRHPFSFNKQVSGAYAQFSGSLEENFLEFIVVGRKFIRSLLGSLFSVFLVMMIAGFILIDPPRIHNFMRSLVPTIYAESYDDWLARLDYGLSGVVRGQALICLINGVLTGIGIAVLGIPFVVTLSVFAAVFSLIPIFGVLISSIPILLMAITVSGTTALLAMAWILFIHFVEGNFLNPKILGDSSKIHPVLIVFALVVGEHFAGVMGALLAVPFFSLIQNSFLFLKQKAESLETAS